MSNSKTVLFHCDVGKIKIKSVLNNVLLLSYFNIKISSDLQIINFIRSYNFMILKKEAKFDRVNLLLNNTDTTWHPPPPQTHGLVFTSFIDF